MSDSRQAAAAFEQLADLLEITGANAFKVNATRKVARLLQDYQGDLRATAETPGGLESIDGIGTGSADRIRQWCDRGVIDETESLLAAVPEGLIALLHISGVGPKSVRRFWQEAGVTDLASLKAAIEDGSLASLPRMGAKTIANISESIAFAERAAARSPIGRALPIAESLITSLADVDGVEQIEYAGSLRRGRETIGDVDLLATASDPGLLVQTFTQRDDVTKVLAAGDTKASVRLKAGVQVDLRIIDASAWGAAMLYFTGSKEHNVLLRQRARDMGLRLNEYGLFPDDGEAESPQSRGIEPIAADTEAAIYAALGLPWRPPELREACDGLADPAPLIEVSDIRRDLHTHTLASDGHLSIEDMAAEAIRRGFDALAITDHSRSSVQANGLSVDRLMTHIDAIRAVDEQFADIRLLAGAEVDIHADGSLDYEDDVLSAMDIVVASPHVALRQSPEDATARLVAAARHPLVHIIGHPTGRMLGRRPGLEPDMAAVCRAAAEHGTALEINANPNRLDLRDVHVRLAIEHGVPIAINTDAHDAAHFDFMRYGVLTGRRGKLTAQACINAWPLERLLDWLDR